MLIAAVGIPALYAQIYDKNLTPIITTNNINVEINNGLNIKYNGVSLFSSTPRGIGYMLIQDYDTLSYISINNNLLTFVFNGEEKTIEIDNSVYAQNHITSVALRGEQTCEYVYISNETADIPTDFEPVWDYHTEFLTHFDKETLNAGQSAEENNAVDIYRENLTTGEIKKIYSVPQNITKIRDFSWITGNKYNYEGYALLGYEYTGENSFTESPICRNQPYYLLLATEQDERQPNVYHVVHYWRFGNNIEAGSVSNNNAPNFLMNFTGYRLKQPTARKGKSGALTALLSNAFDGKYNDTVKQMENLYALSECNNPLFLKNMKGNLYMITVSAPITQTINTKSAYQEVKISISWEEVGSCEGVSIIQLPTDEGWVDDNEQLAEVRLEVDEETGMLKVLYPNEYNNATTFGVEDLELYAKSLDGVEQDGIEIFDNSAILNNEG